MEELDARLGIDAGDLEAQRARRRELAEALGRSPTLRENLLDALLRPLVAELPEVEDPAREVADRIALDRRQRSRPRSRAV